MKNFIKLVSGKKAFVITLVAAILFTALDVVSNIKMGTSFGFDYGMVGMFAALTIWGSALEMESKKEKKRN